MRAVLGAVLVLALVAMAVLPPAVRAGSPHFVNDITVTRSGNTITVSGKEAGLGDEDQVHVVVTLSAACINPGSKHPKAANKESFSAEGDFPVQNGKAEFSLSVTVAFKPDCTPPMSLQFSDLKVCDTTHDLCQNLSVPQ
jgi:hypothetical protein